MLILLKQVLKAGLSVTDDPLVRFCYACENNVYYCSTIHEAADHAEVGHCVAVDPTLARQKGDIEPQPARDFGGEFETMGLLWD